MHQCKECMQASHLQCTATYPLSGCTYDPALNRPQLQHRLMRVCVGVNAGLNVPTPHVQALLLIDAWCTAYPMHGSGCSVLYSSTVECM